MQSDSIIIEHAYHFVIILFENLKYVNCEWQWQLHLNELT